MRVEITHKDDSVYRLNNVTSYSDLDWADRWLWFDLENGERQYILLSTIKRIRFVKEEDK